jgi:hypothetical protein
MNLNSVILYEGNSLYNGEPIVAIATGFIKPSANEKTSDMIQVSLYHRDIPPMEAINTGKDMAVCGDCALRKHICYVDVNKAHRSIWLSYKRGDVLHASETHYKVLRGELELLGRGRVKTRLGAYGDPAMIHYDTWHSIFDGNFSMVTSYTHQWREVVAGMNDTRLFDFTMLSINSLQDYDEAIQHGNVFSVVPANAGISTLSLKEKKMIICPAHYKITDELTGKSVPRKNCKDCMLCQGKNNRGGVNIAIPVHGLGYKVNNYEKVFNNETNE